MSTESDNNQPRVLRAVRQQLESLKRAGVTHIHGPKGGKLLTVAAPATPTTQTKRPETSKQPQPLTNPSAAKSAMAPSPQKATPIPNPQSPIPLQDLLRPADRTALELPREEALAAVAKRVAACTRCSELASTRTQTVFGVGNPYSRLVFLGEAPGADEDRQGEPFVGRAGQLLTDIITKGMKLRREDVYIMNILRCRPPENRSPKPVEAAACREYLDAQLAIIRPEFICCLGTIAAQNLLAVDTAIGRMRGRILDFNGMKVLCTYHPAYVLRNPSAKKQVWEDIQVLMDAMGLK